MTNVVELHRHRMPERGYCSSCRVEMAWPTQGAWPESCPNGCTPLMIQNYLPEPGVMMWMTAQGPPMEIDSA